MIRNPRELDQFKRHRRIFRRLHQYGSCSEGATEWRGTLSANSRDRVGERRTIDEPLRRRSLGRQHTPMLPPLAKLLSRLSARREEFLTELGALDERLLRERPTPESWSILQVAYHLELTERGVVNWLTDPIRSRRQLRRRPSNLLGYVIVLLVLNTSIRVPMPERLRDVLTPPADGDLPTLRLRWEETAAAMERQFASYTPEDRRRYVALHPFGGPLTPEQLLLFLNRHFRHHLGQVARIRAQLDRR